MGPPAVSKATAKFPIFAATFAQNNPAILVVGGGGGAGRSGVPNSICAFDTSSRAPTLEPFTSIDLSRDEDSVTSVAAVSTHQGCILYAGINSSEEERLKGQNAHLRAFELTYPKRKAEGDASEGGLQYLSKAQLLSATTEAGQKEGYQRLVRLSPPAPKGKSGGKRIGAVASSLQGDENELVIFPAVSTKPQTSEVIQRIPLKDKEANDVDIFETEEGHFQVAYCQDYWVYVQRFTYDFNKGRTVEKLGAPAKAYEVPVPDVFNKKWRSKIRALRWLSPDHLLLLVNKPYRSGVELQVLRLYSEDGMGSIVMRKSLKRKTKQAVDMDVVRLNADDDGKYQIAIAVATQDVSLHLFTVDYNGGSLSHFHQYNVYRKVHDVQMTKVVWSPFSTPEASEKQPPSRFLRLASTSLSGSISVDTFELKPESSRPNARFILLSHRNRNLYNMALYAACAFIALMLAIMVQSLIDPQGNLTKGILPSYLQNAASGAKAPGVIMEDARRAQAAMNNAGHQAVKTSTTQRIRDLLHLHKPRRSDAPPKALIVYLDPDTETSVSTELHEGGEEDLVKKYTEAKRWEELSQEQRKVWKNKLVDAGMWAVEEGETILKSIFFAQAGGLVGHVVDGVLHG